MELDLLKTKINLKREILSVPNDSLTNGIKPDWSKNPIKSAVLVGFTRDKYSNQAQIILTRRVDNLGSHSSEISLPGGKMEEGETVGDTAIRETEEEIGIGRKFIETNIIMPVCYTATGYCVTPVIGYIASGASYKINTKEVSKLHKVYISDFINNKNVDFIDRYKAYNHNGYDKNIIYTIKDNDEQLVIWGVTAAIINKLIQILN